MRRQTSPPGIVRHDYVELAGSSRNERLTKWWRATNSSFNEHVPLSCPSVRPSSLVLSAKEVTSKGTITPIVISRSELLGSTVISPEELRSMLLVGVHRLQNDANHIEDSAQSLMSCKPATVFALKQGSLLLSIGSIRAIVERTRMLIFERGDEDSAEFLRMLQENPKAVDGNFLRYCADLALLTTIRKLDSCIHSVREVSETIIGDSSMFRVVRLREMDLERIRQQRLMLLKCSSQASDVASTLLSSLNNGQSALLSGLGEEEIQEWTIMLELYLQAYGECSDECAKLLSIIDNFEESTGLAMQARRLHIEEFELSLVIAAVSISFAALVPGAFGMNLKSGLEQQNHVFSITILVTIIVIISLFSVIRYLAALRGIFN